MFRLLHLSDIHFNKKKGLSDSNIEVRDGIEHDLACLMKEDPRPIDFVLVCGDIAYSGKKAEYEKAKDWLDKLCEIVQCKASSVMLVPGNHDIDRDGLKKSLIQELLHKHIRSNTEIEIDKTFEKIIDGDEIKHLTSTQVAYENFAAIYYCEVERNKITWERKLGTINNIDIMLKGCNSALLADEDDDKNKDRMALSKYQSYLKDKLNTIYIIMCHHPTECMIDNKKVEESFNEKSILQLYGHNHKYNIEIKEKSLILHAGAVKPNDNEPEQPWYNIIDIDIDDNKFKMEVWPRKWNGRKFETGTKNGKLLEKHFIKIPNIQTNWTNNITDMAIDSLINVNDTKDINEFALIGKDKMEYTERDIRYKFLSLPFRERKELGTKLISYAFDDYKLSEMNRSLNFLNEIKRTNRYDELWELLKS
jgi:predicted phosphodiesterase